MSAILFKTFVARTLAAFAIISLLAGCNDHAKTDQATSIYSNGQVISVDDNVGTVEAIAVKEGRIIALGSNKAMEQYRSESTSHFCKSATRPRWPG